MTLFNKILIVAGMVFTLGILVFIAYQQHKISTQQQTIQEQIIKQKELSDNIMRSQNEYATKNDIDKFIKDNGVSLQAIQNDLNSLHATLIAANVITVHSSGQISTNIHSSNLGEKNPDPIKNTDTFGYAQRAQLLDIHEDFNGTQIPIGQVGFSAWQSAPWNVNILPREYKVSSVIGTDENQRTYVYNKFSIKVDNKDYDVKITSAETKQEFPQAKWNLWNPRLFLTSGGAVNLTQLGGDIYLGATVGAISYGKFKTNPDISVLQIGIGYQSISKTPSIVINPISGNIGHLLTNGLIGNTYLGPSIQFGLNKDIFVGAGLSVGL